MRTPTVKVKRKYWHIFGVNNSILRANNVQTSVALWCKIRQNAAKNQEKQGKIFAKNTKKSPNISYNFLILGDLRLVGMTGFEPATTRPPDVYSNRAELHPESDKAVFAVSYLPCPVARERLELSTS